MGFNYITGIGEIAAEHIQSMRQDADYSTLSDFCRRTRLPKRLIENLILAGAMDAWYTPRRALLWELGQLDNRIQTLDLQPSHSDVTLPELTSIEAISDENRILGVTTGEHVMCRYRQWLSQRRVESSKSLENCDAGRYVWVAGLVVVHQSPPTAKGHHFITLEDEDGFLNIIVRPKVYARLWRILRESKLLAVKGEIQRQGAVINVLATDALPLPHIEIS